MNRAIQLVLAAAVGAACSSPPVDGPAPPEEDACPPPGGEFPPSDCALVRGIATDEAGRILTGIPIRVDSVIHPNFHYASSPVTSESDGSFSLTVFRTDRLLPITTPDTATVELKAYATPHPKPRDIPVARAPVLMYFAPLGEPVKPSIVEAVFDYGNPP